MTPALEIFRIETEPILSGSPTIGIVDSPTIDDSGDVLAPDMGIPNLPGIDIPGFDLPGLNMPK